MTKIELIKGLLKVNEDNLKDPHFKAVADYLSGKIAAYKTVIEYLEETPR